MSFQRHIPRSLARRGMLINLFQDLDTLFWFNFKNLRSTRFLLWKRSCRVTVMTSNNVQKANVIMLGGCQYSMADIFRGITMSKTGASESDKNRSWYHRLLALCL